ncbi:MAG: uroporphyrinogen-III synthase [Methanomassiliicoccales archaeon]|nr:uroporphyrinogen-III synthase [Methanomassiliicoccales archaeon]TFG55906.1 MAG: uroporphyrinogen-III synthase [Methanomassiliicoccus sp.]
MKKVVAILGPPERWTPLCREHRHLADFICVSPVRAVPRDDVDFSLFLVDLFSGRYDVLVATCPTAIEAAVGMARNRNMLERLQEATRRTELVTIGERTTDRAAYHGLTVSSEAPEATTDSLIGQLNRKERRGTVALLRSDQGSPQLIKGLKDAGWNVVEVKVYSLLLDESEMMISLLDRLEEGGVDVLVFPTPAHVQAFLLQLIERCGKEELPLVLEGVTVAAMGRETRERLEEYGVKVDMVPVKTTPEHLLKELLHDL